jgi:hypothetical protein
MDVTVMTTHIHTRLKNPIQDSESNSMGKNPDDTLMKKISLSTNIRIDKKGNASDGNKRQLRPKGG